MAFHGSVTISRTIRKLAVASIVAVLTLAACGDDNDTATESSDAEPASTEPTVSAELQGEITEICDLDRYAAIPPLDGTPERVTEVVAYLREAGASTPPLDALEVPPELQPGFELVLDAAGSASDALEAAEDAAAAGDMALADRQIHRHGAHLWSITGRFALMGARCAAADPDRADGADLNVPLDLHGEQLNTGFGSVWVSQKYGDDVVRVDPDSGEILATIPVGTDPLKLQPADGRMWVRTADAYVAIDEATNTVTDSLAKADVGPAANRSFAIDGAMWICDGRRLHRYDPTTLEPVTAIDLGVPCDFVYATPDLVVTWNDDDAPAESGASATVMIDPATNQVLATISLPVDVVWPVVFDDTVFFAGDLNTSAVVIDRDTWSVASTIELPDVVGGGGITTDGRSIFVPTRGEEPWDVLVLDAETFEHVDTIEPLNVNGVVAEDGALWLVHPDGNVLQRFDVQR